METMGFIIAGLVAMYHVWRSRHWDKERREYSDRLMSKSLAEFQYYQREHKQDIKDVRDYNKDVKKIRLQEIEKGFPVDKDLQKALSGYEEDWGEEEVDAEFIKRLDKDFDMERENEDRGKLE